MPAPFSLWVNVGAAAPINKQTLFQPHLTGRSTTGLTRIEHFNSLLRGTHVRMLYLTVCILVFVSACADTRRKDILEEYNDNVRKIGLIPVYPPTEDVQVGDLYLVSTPKQDRHNLANPNDKVRVYLGTVPEAIALAEQHLNERIVFARTGKATIENAKGENVSVQNDLYSGREVLQRRIEKNILSLPVAAFPEIQADAGSGTSLGIVRALQAFGLATGSRTEVTLNFNDVRTYGAPGIANATILGRKAEESLGKIIRAGGNLMLHEQLDQEFRKFLVQRRARGPNSSGAIELDEARRCQQLSVVTKVYLTRKITYTYSNAQIRAAGLKRATSTTVAGTAGDAPNIQTVIVDVNDPAKNPDADDVNLVTNKDLSSVQDNLMTAINSGKIGEGVSFQSWDALGLRFEQNFERPVVIAQETIIAIPTNKVNADNLWPTTVEESNRLDKTRPDLINNCRP